MSILRNSPVPCGIIVTVILASSLGAESVFDLKPFVVVAPHVAKADAFVTGERIRSAKPVDLATSLANEMPGVALSRRGPVAGDIVLRGLSRDNIVITVDGMPTYCACPNRMDPPAFHVSSQQIEAVSIRTGPFSVEEGASVGGTILVGTRPAGPDPFLNAHVYAGRFGYRAAGLSAGIAPDGSRFRASGGVYHQSGEVYEDGSGIPFTLFDGTNFLPAYVDREAFSVTTAEARVRAVLSPKTVVKLHYGYQDGGDVLYPGLRMDAVKDSMHRGALILERKVDEWWADSLEGVLSFSTVDHDMTDSYRKSSVMNPAFLERGFMMRTEAASSHRGIRIKAERVAGESAVRYGLDVNRRHWDADNRIMMLENSMIPNVRVLKYGLWAVRETRTGPWAWEAGARLDLARSKARDDLSFLRSYRGNAGDTASDFLPSAYVLLNRQIGENASLYGGIGHAARVPDPQERFINLDRPADKPDWVGNPGLDPVRVTEIQAGARLAWDSLNIVVNTHYSWLADYIYLSRFSTENGMATSYENIDARLYGAEVTVAIPVGGQVSLNAGLSYNRGRKVTRPPGATNDRLAEIPPLRGMVGCEYGTEALRIRLEAQFQDQTSRIDADLNERELDGFVVLNFSAAFKAADRITVSGGIDNILDETYAVANAYVRDPFSSGVVVNEPGRFAYVRLAVAY